VQKVLQYFGHSLYYINIKTRLHMSGWLILFVGAIYLIVGTKMFLQGNNGMAITFLAYAVSNYGLYLAAR
jgi:hypothetical protein